MQTQSQAKLANIIVEELDLDNVTAADIIPTARLFSLEDGGLGLDSIDALEIALAVNEQFGVEIRMDDDTNEDALKALFYSLESLDAYIKEQS